MTNILHTNLSIQVKDDGVIVCMNQKKLCDVDSVFIIFF